MLRMSSPYLLMPQIQRIMAQSFRQSHQGSGFFGFHVTPPWSITEPTKASHTLARILVRGVDIHFSHSLSSGEPRLSLTPWADIAWVFDQSLSYDIARLVYPQHPLLAQGGVSADTTTTDNTGVLARFLEDIMAIIRDQELGLLHVEMDPLLSMPAFHAVSLKIHFSWESMMSTGSSAKRSSHGTPVPNSSENASSTRLKSSGLRTEPWCTPTPTPNSSLYWLLTRTWLRALEYMHWMTHTAHSSTLRLLKTHYRTFLGTGLKAFQGRRRQSGVVS